MRIGGSNLDLDPRTLAFVSGKNSIPGSTLNSFFRDMNGIIEQIAWQVMVQCLTRVEVPILFGNLVHFGHIPHFLDGKRSYLACLSARTTMPSGSRGFVPWLAA